jgi:hypothetical protein
MVTSGEMIVFPLKAETIRLLPPCPVPKLAFVEPADRQPLSRRCNLMGRSQNFDIQNIFKVCTGLCSSITMTDKMKCLICALVALAILVLPSSASVVDNASGNAPGDDGFSPPGENQTIAIDPDCSQSQAFYGNVTIEDKPALEHANIAVAGEGVCPNTSGNPASVVTNGTYGSAEGAGQQLLVRGCIENGTPLTFTVDGLPAELYDLNTSGPWQSTFPFHAGELTNLDIRVIPTDPPPDSVSIHTIGVTISNATLSFFQSVIVEKNPWMELRLAGGVFNVEISATGYHDFRGFPLLGRNATLGIYENGSPVAPEVKVAFGSRTARYAYVANGTRTFDICIFVDEQPDIRAVKQVTVFFGRDENASSGRGMVEGASPKDPFSWIRLPFKKPSVIETGWQKNS